MEVLVIGVRNEQGQSPHNEGAIKFALENCKKG